MKAPPDRAVAPAGLGPDDAGAALAAGGPAVAYFGPWEERPSRAGRWLRCAGGRIEPGRVNAHTHVYSGLAPLGMPPPAAPPRSFLQILQRIWWRLDRALDAQSLRAAARFYVAEALAAGTTALIDHHESPNFIEGSLDVIADACQDLGMRAVLCYGATERNGGREEARRGLAECGRFVRSNRRPLVRGVVGLHASFTVSDDTIREAAQLCRDLATVMHVHMAEDRIDVEDAKSRGYEGPLERMSELGALPAGSILAHGVHLTPEQVRKAASGGCWFVHNPRSNAGNGVGFPSALSESRCVALGTDGYPADMMVEKASLARGSCSGGWAAADLDRRLEAGHDLLAEIFGIPFAPLRTGGAADAAVDTAEGTRHLMVGGRVVVEEGRLTAADGEAIREEARAAASRLWSRMEAVV